MKYCLVNLFIIALLSCQSNNLTESAQIHFEEKGIVFPKELKHCIIIPGGGCSGCIAAGMDYILNAAICSCDAEMLQDDNDNDNDEKLNVNNMINAFTSELLSFNFDVMKCYYIKSDIIN